MARATMPLSDAESPKAPVRFSSTLASEWTKLVSLRSTYITLGLAVILSIAFTVLVVIVVGANWDNLSASEREDFDPITISFFGSIFSAILIVVLGVNAVASEYSSGMIRLTLTATPRRGRLLVAKLLAIGIVTLVIGFALQVAQFLITQFILGSYDVPTVKLSDTDALRVVIANGVMSPILPVIAATVAVLLRNTAAAITSVLALIFAPAIFGPLFPNWWQENVLSYVLGPATDSIAIGHLDSDEPTRLSLGGAIVVVAAWVAAFVGMAYATLVKRDA